MTHDKVRSCPKVGGCYYCWQVHPLTRALLVLFPLTFHLLLKTEILCTFTCWKRSSAPPPPPKSFWLTTELHLVCIWFLFDRKLHSSSTADTSIQSEEKKRVAVLGQGWRLQRSQLDWAISIHAIWSFVFQDRLLHPESWHSSPYWGRGGVEILSWPAKLFRNIEWIVDLFILVLHYKGQCWRKWIEMPSLTAGFELQHIRWGDWVLVVGLGSI